MSVKKTITRVFVVLLAALLLCGALPLLSASAAFATDPMIAARSSCSLALKSDGSVWAWGYNARGQLGDGTRTNRKLPVQVQNLSEVAAIAVGGQHCLALKSDGTVWAWGANYDAQLGDTTLDDRYTPVQVRDISGVIAIAAGSNHSLALKSDGTVWAWGDNWYGQLGDGAMDNRRTPAQVPGLADITAIVAGNDHNLALKSDGTIMAWGHNNYGSCGCNTTFFCFRSPVQTHIIDDAVAIAAGHYHSLALRSDGSVWAWGINHDGQLGDDTITNRLVPVPVYNYYLKDVAAVGTGLSHSIAVKGDGTVWTWGQNENGQLGDRNRTDCRVPVQVQSLSNVTAVTGGYDHTLALRSDGTIWTCGVIYVDLGLTIFQDSRTSGYVQCTCGKEPFNLLGNCTNPGGGQQPKIIFSTKYEANFLNWLKFFLLFGWLWMNWF